jgi:F-type H+-transporting ATPase subunit gamma
MAGAKEIRSKISSIKNTQKITKAMQMVAASKMRKAQDRMRAARPYAEKIREVIGHLRHANPDYKHPYLIERTVKSTGMIVISTDRGLCGSLNVNVLKSALAAIRQAQGRGEQVRIVVIGTKALTFFRRIGVDISASATQLGDKPQVAALIGSIKVMLDDFRAGRIDRLLLIHNEFVNTMSQKAAVAQLLPVVETGTGGGPQARWDYIYEPSAAEILDGILTRYVESQVYQGAVENVACEMAARMVAMKSASDNAGKFIGELQLIYNKARQAAITTELSEIVGGAAAV